MHQDRYIKHFVGAITAALTAALKGEIKTADQLEELHYSLDSTWDMGFNDGGVSQQSRTTLAVKHAIDKALVDMAKLNGVEFPELPPEPGIEPASVGGRNGPPSLYGIDRDDVPF